MAMVTVNLYSAKYESLVRGAFYFTQWNHDWAKWSSVACD